MNRLKKLAALIPDLWNRIFNQMTLKYRRVSCKQMPVIHGRLNIYGHGRIVLGKGVTINSSASSNPIGGDCRTVFSIVPGAVLTIGDRVGISNSTIVCHSSVTLGNDVVIGGSVKIYDTDFHKLSDGRKELDDRRAARKGAVVIRDRAFVGAHSMILKGVTIGEGAVIGAGSVVTKDVPAGEVWAGNPAVKIKAKQSSQPRDSET